MLVLLAYFVVLNLINMAALTFLPPPPMPPPPPAPQEDEYALGGEQGPAEAKRSDVVVPITKVRPCAALVQAGAPPWQPRTTALASKYVNVPLA